MDKQQLVKLESHRKDQLRELAEQKAAVDHREKAITERETALEAQKRALEAQERRDDIQSLKKENEALRASNRALTAKCSTLEDVNDRLQRLVNQYMAKIHEIAEGIGYAARRFFSLEGPNGKTFDDAAYPDEPSDQLIAAIESPLEEPAKSNFLERE